MKKIVLFFFLFSFYASYGQKFLKTYKFNVGTELGQKAMQTSDGGYVVVGRANLSGSGYYDIYVVKTDASGAVTWSKTFGGAYNDFGYDVKQTTDGGYIITGSMDDGTKTSFYIIKINSAGTLTWSKSYSDIVTTTYSYSIEQTTDGGYIVAGNGQSAFLIKTNSSGDSLWAKRYYTTGFTPNALVIRQTSDGGYIVAGQCIPAFDAWLMKINSSGVPSWSKTFGGSSGDDVFYDISINTDGGYTLCGETKFGSGGRDVFVVRTNSAGDTLWTRTYGGATEDYARTVRQTPDGGFIVAGSTDSYAPGGVNGYLLKINSNGSLNWSRTYGNTGNDYLNSANRTSDGGYILTGFAYSFGSGGNCPLWLIKTDSTGASCFDFPAASIVTTPHTVLATQALANVPNGSINAHTTNVATGATATTQCFIGIDEVENDGYIFSVYPNPTRNSFTISCSEESRIRNGKLAIYDMTGRLAYTTTLNSKQQDLNPTLSAGVYFVRVSDGEKVWTDKLVIE